MLLNKVIWLMDCDVRLLGRLELVNKMESLALFWEVPMGVLYILFLPVICNLAVAGLLAQDFPAACTQYPDLCPFSPCRVQMLLSWLESGKKSLSVVQTQIRNVLPVSFRAIGFGVFVECVYLTPRWCRTNFSLYFFFFLHEWWVEYCVPQLMLI